MKILCLDVETTTYNKGNPFDPRNNLVSVVIYDGTTFKEWYKDFTGLDEELRSADLLIGFNVKFDLHWLNAIGIDTSVLTLWDCQYVEYLLSAQQWKYPSLDETAKRYEVGHKIDIIKSEYWDKGIDTLDIPPDLLLEYNKEDVRLTWDIYQLQKNILSDAQVNLFYVHMADIHVIIEMERNGLLFNVSGSLEKASELECEADKEVEWLRQTAGGDWFDPASNDHLSALLYGGVIVEERRLPVGTYKTGARMGQARFKVMKVDHTLPRLIEPLKNTEYKKGGVWSTDESILLSLPTSNLTRKIKDAILKLRGINKLCSTYLRGIPKVISNMNWYNNTIHSTLNNCSTTTGRLSSTKPNQQNFDKETKQFIVSRYD